MGFFDSLGSALKNTAEKNNSIKKAVNTMSETELISLYKKSKRKGDFLTLGNTISALKENYGYTDEDLRNL
ncbi:hypothetical protein [uncultured Fusobacterium sp.]|jgi:hypothetical protein|uniref:hypothetical protein n=1 Tax=uncultured Fusobacterium sp. TaxID=159267 RepID=UPI0025FEBD8D|nr:hypothetical protein [uncultured Fusobacterium sp.]